MPLTYKDKIDNSIVIKTKQIKNEKMYISTKKSRMISLIIFSLVAIFNIVSLIINPEKYSWAIAVVACIISVISMMIIKSTSRSIFSLNHQKFCKGVDFVNKTSKLVLFLNSTNNFNGEINDEISYITNGVSNSFLDLVFKNSDILIDTVKVLLETKIFTFILFAVSIVLFIPVFIYFVIFNAKIIGLVILMCIPVVNIIVLVKWLLSTKGKFTEYVKIDGVFYKNTRKITVEHYRKKHFINRLLFVIWSSVLLNIAFWIILFIVIL